MKYIYLFAFLLFTSFSFSQNELVGEWFVHYTNIDNNQQYSTVPNSNNNITFEETFFNGSVCNNGYGGSYTFNGNNTINITNFAALGGGCNIESEIFLFLNPYLFDFLNYFDTDPVYSYTISGSGASETLTLTSGNNDFVVYGKEPQPTEILGQWYLDYVEVNSIIHNNYYNEQESMDINFTVSPQSPDSFLLTGKSSCNEYVGNYSANLNAITLNDLNITLVDCSGTPNGIYENLYLPIIGGNETLPIDLPYNIVGNGDDQVLTITNPNTGDKAIYGRNENADVLTRTWYLSRIEIPGNPTIEIFTTESPSLTLTNDINPLTFRTTAFGEGECNAFMSDYEVSLSNGDNIHLLDFSPTLGFCESDYESEYFNIIGFPPNNFCEFEITNNGTTLNVTDLLGARLVFGDEPLSILENEINALHITLKNNPVTTEINLSVSRSGSELNYQIYSIDGKLVKEAKLRSESINVYGLNSGLYFIRFFNNSNKLQTLKFIKQ